MEILYEDENIVVVNKPSGLVVHADGRTKEHTLCDWILENYPETKNVGESIELKDGEKIERPGIVHRLDRETSGVLLIAKNSDTFEELKEKFKNREIQKTYYALVYDTLPSGDDGVIDRPIGKSKKDFRLWSAQRGARGEMREAVTEYEVLKRENGLALVKIKPKTGRTHQIRVHFKALNAPVVCDSLYAPKRECPKSIGRLALHSQTIELEFGGKDIKIEAQLPDFFNI